jgi:hypothetical protein
VSGVVEFGEFALLGLPALTVVIVCNHDSLRPVIKAAEHMILLLIAVGHIVPGPRKLRRAGSKECEIGRSGVND